MSVSRTQIRQQQLTGSTVDIKARLDNSAATNNAQPNTAALLTGSSQLDIFGYVGAALHRIHGAASTEPFNNAVSTLSDGTSARITYVDGQATVINSEGGTTALTVGQTGTPGDISVTAAGDLTVTADLAVNGNTTLGNAASDTTLIKGPLTAESTVTIVGDLKVTGAVSTTYITSSVVELQDPVLVTNAADMSANASEGRKAGTSFLSASSDIENSNGTQNYDYGLIYKRALGFNEQNGANNGAGTADQIKSLQTIVEGGNEKFSTSAIGSVFGVFKTTGFDGGGNIAPAGGVRDFILDSERVRNGANNIDILGAHLGAFCVVSSSVGSGKKRFGVVESVTSNRVKINILKNTERYDGVQLADEIQSSDMSTTNAGSIQLLSAYAGTIFDKEEYEFHHAAAAITGSGDNKFISGSANIMLYGGINSAKMTLHQNNLVSGSMVIGDFDLAAESEESTTTFTRLQSQNGKDLMLKSSADLILSASGVNGRVRMVTDDGSTIKFPTAAGTTDQIMKIGASAGQLEFSGVGDLIPSLSRAMMRVKKGVTIAAGVGGLILTGADNAASSQHFITASSGLTGRNADKIHALTDAELFSRISLFCNGQLLVSGSGTAAGVASDADYVLKRVDANNVSGSFAFDLEEDDTITLIVQAKS